MATLDCLPATAPEVAAQLGISVYHANARLQDYARRGLAYRTEQAVIPLEKTRGRYPHIWVRVPVIAAEPKENP